MQGLEAAFVKKIVDTSIGNKVLSTRRIGSPRALALLALLRALLRALLSPPTLTWWGFRGSHKEWIPCGKLRVKIHP